MCDSPRQESIHRHFQIFSAGTEALHGVGCRLIHTSDWGAMFKWDMLDQGYTSEMEFLILHSSARYLNPNGCTLCPRISSIFDQHISPFVGPTDTGNNLYPVLSRLKQ